MTWDDVNRTLRRARKRLVNVVPHRVTRRFSGPYNRWHSLKADWRFHRRRRDFPELSPNPDAPRHVVCVVVDALRSDVIDMELTPFLDGLDGTDAVTPSPWTFPAVSSIITGRYPHEHGAVRQSDEIPEKLTLPPTSSRELTLPEAFASAGYDTYGAFGFLMPFLPLSGRFRTHTLYSNAPAERILAEYESWVGTRTKDRTFAYLHLADPHIPVDPPHPYWRDHGVDRSIPDIKRWDYADVTGWKPPDDGLPPGWASNADDGSHPDAERYREHRARLYRASVDYVDDQLDAFHDRLAARLDGELLFVVLSDHGEGFWEQAAFDAGHFVDSRPAYAARHGGTPYEAIARVPLLTDGLSLPDDSPVSLIDIAPTLLELLGHRDAVDTTGRSLLEDPPTDRALLTESARYGHEKKAVTIDGWKLIASRGDDVVAEFSLPEETPAEIPESIKRSAIDSLPPWPEGEAPTTIDPAVEKRLERLGYT